MKQLIFGSLFLAMSNLLAGEAGVARAQEGFTVLTFSPTPTLDACIDSTCLLKLTGNVTGATIRTATSPADRFLNLALCQDATGGRTFTWPGSFLRPPTLPAAANACMTAEFVFDGTNWRQRATPRDSSPFGVANACTAPQTFSTWNNAVLVDGTTYPLTPTGIQNAIKSVSATRGGMVIISSTGNNFPGGDPPWIPVGSFVDMGSTGLTLPSGVCLVGAAPGYFQTTLRWTSGTPSGITLNNGTKSACVQGITLSFSSGTSNAVGIRLNGVVGALNQTQWNTFRDIYINFEQQQSGTSCIFAPSTGVGIGGVSLNTFDNVRCQLANQLAVATKTEGDFWKIEGTNLGWAAGASLMQFTDTNDEIIDARVESGSTSAANLICLSLGQTLAQTQGNIVRIICDTGSTGAKAISEIGSKQNIFDIALIGTATLGTVASSSTYRLSPVSASVSSFFPALTIGSGSALTSSGSGGTPATLTGTETLSNKTLSGPINATSNMRFKLADQGQCTMVAGACRVQKLGSTYSVAPLCVVTWTGAGALAGTIKVVSTTRTVTPSSSNAADTAQVNWACFGN